MNVLLEKGVTINERESSVRKWLSWLKLEHLQPLMRWKVQEKSSIHEWGGSYRKIVQFSDRNSFNRKRAQFTPTWTDLTITNEVENIEKCYSSLIFNSQLDNTGKEQLLLLEQI